MPIRYRQPWLTMAPAHDGLGRLPSLAGDGQFILAPLIPTVWVNFRLRQALLSKTKCAPITLPTIGILAVNDKSLGSFQLRPQRRVALIELLQGKIDRALNMTELVIRK